MEVLAGLHKAGRKGSSGAAKAYLALEPQVTAPPLPGATEGVPAPDKEPPKGKKEQAQAECEQKGDAAAHGLHRWQQGFDLAEVTRELGRLNECVLVELESYAVEHPSLHSGVMAEARKIWALKRAYERNGNSMVRELHLGSIDLSQENPPVIADPNEVNALDTAATPPASTRSRRRRDK